MLGGCGGDGGEEITFSHIIGPDSEWQSGAERFKDLVESESAEAGPPLKVSLFTNASLSNHNQQTELDMVQGGSLTMSWESSILLSTLDPAWSAFSLPWLLDDYEDAEALCQGALGREMLDRLAAKRLTGLGYGFNGFRQLTNSKKPVSAPEDLAGMRVRVPSIQMYISLFERWGAQPSSMNFGELIPALRSGAMDGQENPLHVISSAKLYEVQKYISIWRYSFDPLVLCVNKEWWDAQSDERRRLLQECADEACRYQRQLVRDRETEHLKELLDKGMQAVTLTPGQIQSFRESAATVYEEYRNKIGGDLMDRFVAEAQRLRDSG